MLKLKQEWKLIQVLSAILWPSFLLAGIASMLFFATFDPTELGHFATFPMELSRTAGYTFGFLLFWLLGAASSAAGLFLLGVLDVEFH